MNPDEHKAKHPRDICPDNIDSELDEILASYSRAEPRSGLEGRIIANLRTEWQHGRVRLWWRWPSVALVLFVIALAISARWKFSAPAQSGTAGPARLSTVLPPVILSSPVASTSTRKSLARSNRVARGSTNPPKLAQFPSRQPLSEQEKVLADYVARFRAEAVLVARVNREEFIRDGEQMTVGPRARTDLPEFDEKETTNR